METRKLPSAIIIGIVGFVLLTLFGSSMFYTIDPGEKGIIFKRFGGGLDKDNIYPQGFHVIAPWNTLHIYDIKIHEKFVVMEVLSNDGLPIQVDLSFRYMPIKDKIGYLHDEIGRNYLERIIIPEIRSVTREVIGNYLPKELYAQKRELIEDEIYARTKGKVAAKHIFLDAILIKDVTLPLVIRTAIEKKLAQEQESLEYKFRIEKEIKEAERKEIEAKGIFEFQRIVNRSITPQLLKWKGIEATQEIAKSSNAKVIVIGNGDGDLPIILGGQ